MKTNKTKTNKQKVALLAQQTAKLTKQKQKSGKVIWAGMVGFSNTWEVEAEGSRFQNHPKQAVL